MVFLILGVAIFAMGILVGSGYTATTIGKKLEMKAYESLSFDEFEMFKELVKKIK